MQLGALFTLLGLAPCMSPDVAMTFNGLVLCAYAFTGMNNLLPGLIFSGVIFQAGGVIFKDNVNFFRWLDGVRLEATMVALIPAMLLTVVAVILGVFFYYTGTTVPKRTKRVVS